jgi:hypothetical protein
LRLDFTLAKRGVSRPPVTQGTPPDTVRTDGQKLTFARRAALPLGPGRTQSVDARNGRQALLARVRELSLRTRTDRRHRDRAHEIKKGQLDAIKDRASSAANQFYSLAF